MQEKEFTNSSQMQDVNYLLTFRAKKLLLENLWISGLQRHTLLAEKV